MAVAVAIRTIITPLDAGFGETVAANITRPSCSVPHPAPFSHNPHTGAVDLRWKLPSRRLRRARDQGDPHAGLVDRSGGAGRRVRGHAQLRAAPAALRRCGAEARGPARRGGRRGTRRHRGGTPPRGAASRDSVDGGGFRGGGSWGSSERAAATRAPARVLDDPQARLRRGGFWPPRDAT